MWNKTAAAERLGILYPIVQGPFGGGLSTTKLVATISNAGGMGSYGAESLSPDGIRDVVAELKSLTSNAFAINLWVPKGSVAAPTVSEYHLNMQRFDEYYRELGLARPQRPEHYGQDYSQQVEALLEARPPVFSFVYGVPEEDVLEKCRAYGIRTVGTATTPDEAAALDAAGVDCVIASSFEAGGHKGAFLKPVDRSLVGMFSLLPQIVDRVSIPVIAAGGIADARGLKAAFALGAQGAQIGTAFLACDESGASPAHRRLLFEGARDDTVLTRSFTGRLARSLRNRFSEDMEPLQQLFPDYPVQSWFAGSLKSAAIAQGRSDLISLWAGQSTPLVRHRKALDLFEELVSGLSE
jgi:nitronate monooxygenase